jgi:small subunit ribosomal protein S3
MNSIMEAGAAGVEIRVNGKIRSERARHEKYKEGVVPKSGDTASKIVQEATTDVLLKLGLCGIKIKIALRDSIPPEIEILPESNPKNGGTSPA